MYCGISYDVYNTVVLSPVQSDGQQNEEYRKLQHNLDKITHYLAVNIDPELLAVRLYASEMITHSLVEEASMNTIAKSKRIRVLMSAILSLVELNSEKYSQFLNVLEDIKGLDELVHLLQWTPQITLFQNVIISHCFTLLLYTIIYILLLHVILLFHYYNIIQHCFTIFLYHTLLHHVIIPHCFTMLIPQYAIFISLKCVHVCVKIALVPFYYPIVSLE